jgi:hypothetical protein
MKRNQIRKRKSSKIHLLRRVAKEGGGWTFERLIAEGCFDHWVPGSGYLYFNMDDELNSLIQRLLKQKIPFEISEAPTGCFCVTITEPRS